MRGRKHCTIPAKNCSRPQTTSIRRSPRRQSRQKTEYRLGWALANEVLEGHQVARPHVVWTSLVLRGLYDTAGFGPATPLLKHLARTLREFSTPIDLAVFVQCGSSKHLAKQALDRVSTGILTRMSYAFIVVRVLMSKSLMASP